MPRLAKPTWERFAACYALTGNAAQAYRECGARGKQGPDAGKRGAEYRNKPEVARRIKELRGEIATAATKEFAVSRHDVLAWLTTAFQIPIGAIDADSPYCQHYSQVRTTRRTTTRIVAVDRIKAVVLLGRLCDWEGKESPALTMAPQQAAPADLDAALTDLFATMAKMDSETAEKFPPEVARARGPAPHGYEFPPLRSIRGARTSPEMAGGSLQKWPKSGRVEKTSVRFPKDRFALQA